MTSAMSHRDLCCRCRCDLLSSLSWPRKLCLRCLDLGLTISSTISSLITISASLWIADESGFLFLYSVG
ncbi:hypothetical protein TIFTF001_042291 [Ficus carica]|uniref:Uncharacterized protein n=1 Tax=Ficus carica TaxID=3494 RepID=A0AA87ZKX5_FICCA|nr:hypothetical protein TIFTF001_042291 [Ficus carica]